MAFQAFDPSDEDSLENMRQMFSPALVDKTVRQALQMCWIMLPKDKRNVAEVERQFRRIVDRALKDLGEDGQAFGDS